MPWGYVQVKINSIGYDIFRRLLQTNSEVEAIKIQIYFCHIISLLFCVCMMIAIVFCFCLLSSQSRGCATVRFKLFEVNTHSIMRDFWLKSVHRQLVSCLCINRLGRGKCFPFILNHSVIHQHNFFSTFFNDRWCSWQWYYNKTNITARMWLQCTLIWFLAYHKRTKANLMLALMEFMLWLWWGFKIFCS